MEILNRKERIKSILKWGLINLLLVGIVFIIFWKKPNVEKVLNGTFTEKELEYKRVIQTYDAIFQYIDIKDSVLLDFSSDASIKINPNGVIKIKSFHEEIFVDSVNTELSLSNPLLGNNLVTFYKTIDAIEELKSVAFETPVIKPGIGIQPKIVVDNSKLNKLRKQITNDVNNHILREISGLIHKNALKKDVQSVENVKGLTIVRDNIINYRKSWMQ